MNKCEAALCSRCIYVVSCTVVESGDHSEQRVCSGDVFASSAVFSACNSLYWASIGHLAVLTSHSSCSCRVVLS